jgi:predicted negative regulator of RcsB-dependent stress response
VQGSRALGTILFAASLALAVGGSAAWAADRDEDARTVKDLAYGEVLFYFYQDDHFQALTRLLAGLTRNELPSHARDADLMLGALYLSYGQHRLAGSIFEQVLERSVDSELHDRAWFFLAKIWHQRGYLSEAEGALARIKGELPDTLEPELIMLRAQVLMEQGRFDAALAELESWRRPRDEWVGYSKYNIGVALVRLGRTEEGARVLAEVGELDPDNAELDALRDKANVALGYAWLQAGRPIEAKPPLQRVRLSGPYSNKALLGVGWADAEQQNYRGALAPWLALSGRSLLDAAVQESLLAVPYAFSVLGAEKQAADHYVEAIEALNREIRRLEDSIDGVANGALIEELLAAEGADGSGWYWRLDDIPDTVESRYLYELMAANTFQEGLKSYRDVLYLNENLDHWAESLTAFDDILDTKQRAYTQRLPQVERHLARMNLDEMASYRLGLESRLAEIERTDDAAALGTPAQQDLMRDLVSMEPKLRIVAGDPRGEELADKQRFLKGLLVWDLRRDYRARLWAEQRSLRELDLELKEARRRHHEVDAARTEWPEEFRALTARIAALRPRVEDLRSAARAALTEQQRFLENVAVAELEAQRDRLATYRVQAQFSLAAIYDRAAANGGRPAAPGADTLLAEADR